MFGATMSLYAPPPFSKERPVLSRSRSHTDPSSGTSPSTQPQSAGPKLPSTSTRPPHVRSQSYLSPTDAKPRNAVTLPAATSALDKKATEKVPRLHLPGSTHRNHHHANNHSHSHSHIDGTSSTTYKRHRPTQSDAPGYPRRLASKEALPHLVAGLNAEREKRSTNTSTAASASIFGPSTAHLTDYAPGGRYDLQRPGTSDPDQPSTQPALRPPLKPKTSFEEALERGDNARFAKRLHVKREDIVRRDAELQAAEDEMRVRIAEITATGAEMTRRLDYGYYNLLEKVGHLVATITSFQNLATQTGRLVANIDRESKRLEVDTRKRVKVFEDGFEARRRKAEVLAQRGQRVGQRAEELSARLERARVTVEEWERREDKFKRAWDRVFGIAWWTSIAVVVLVVAVVLGKEWYFHGDPVKAGLRAHKEGSWNKSLRLGGDGAEGERLLFTPGENKIEPSDIGTGNANINAKINAKINANVPDDVRQILLEIAERNRQRKTVFPEVPREIVAGCAEAENCVSDGLKTGTGKGEPDQERDDPRLRMFDEL